MRFEKLNYTNSSKKRIFIYGFLLCAILVIIINLFLTKAKYQVTESIPLASGTINYTLVDFELVEIKFKASGSENYEDVETIEDNYELNQDMSYCTEKYTNEADSFEDVENDSLTIEFNKDTKTISVKPYSKKGTKCYLYFDEIEQLCSEGDTTCKTLFGNATISPSCPKLDENGDGTVTGIESTNAMICKASDDFGTSYYYRGTVDNNWVKFGRGTKGETGDIWWRIIRINGNGTIRLIYAGTSSTSSAPETTGNTTMIKPRTGGITYPRAVYFNKIKTDNKYVGYMYNESPTVSTTHDEAHKVDSSSTKSTVLEEIEYWYNNNTNLSSLAEYIDVETGFCSDTNLATGNHDEYTGAGYGSEYTAYAATDRVWQQNSESTNNSEQTPTLKCGYDVIGKRLNKTAQKRDLYTGPNATSGGTKGSNDETVEGNNALPVPVGLITMDEVIYAGGFAQKNNTGYWLDAGQYYWIMTPYNYYYNSSSLHYALVFKVTNKGNLSNSDVNEFNSGVRPVINLKANTTFTFNKDEPAGTTTNPYVVQTS